MRNKKSCKTCGFFDKKDNGCSYYLDFKKRRFCKEYIKRVFCPINKEHKVIITCAEGNSQFYCYVCEFWFGKDQVIGQLNHFSRWYYRLLQLLLPNSRAHWSSERMEDIKVVA